MDIESITGNEGRVGDLLNDELLRLGLRIAESPVEGARSQCLGHVSGHPKPGHCFFHPHGYRAAVYCFVRRCGPRYGRGSCDAKGIIAAQVAAAERLKQEGIYVGLLFLVGEERDSLGAKVANEQSYGNKFLINGEPTENRLASASKGTLRVEVIAKGRMAHSAYPELGESAIDKLLEALNRLRDETACG